MRSFGDAVASLRFAQLIQSPTRSISRRFTAKIGDRRTASEAKKQQVSAQTPRVGLRYPTTAHLGRHNDGQAVKFSEIDVAGHECCA